MDNLFCRIHQTQWFKKGNMKAYAHPVKDETGETVGWCHMPKDAVPEIVHEAVKQGGVIEKIESKPEIKNRSYALSYAKDIGVALISKDKECSAKKIIEIAREFESYLNGG